MLFPDGWEQRSMGIKRSPNLQVICHHVWCTTEVPERHTKYCIYSNSNFCEEVRRSGQECPQCPQGPGKCHLEKVMGSWGPQRLAWPSCWGCPALAQRASGQAGLHLGALLHPHLFIRVRVLPYVPPASSVRRILSMSRSWILAAI